MARNEELTEIEVTVKRQGDRAVLVTNDTGDEAWIPHSLIDDSSEVHERTPVGADAVLVIPEWKATELGWG